MTESNERGTRNAERGANGKTAAPDVVPGSPSVENPVRKRIEDLQAFVHLVREAHAHILGAQYRRPDDRLWLMLQDLAAIGREADAELAAFPIRIDAADPDPDFAETAEAADKSVILNPPIPPGAALDDADQAPRRAACNVTAEIPPGGRITCGPLRLRRRGFGSNVVIEMQGEIMIDAILTSMTVRIRTFGRWYPEVQASEADLPLVLTGQGDGQREIREEDV